MGPSQQIYCICRRDYDGDSFMIECDACKEWFHGKCVNITEAQAGELDIYYCLGCQRIHGTPPRKNVQESVKPSLKAGTALFVKMLKARNFLSSSHVLRRLEAFELTLTYFETYGFNNPIYVECKEGLGLNLPPSTFSVADMSKYVDPEKVLDVIDVCKQQEIKMPLKDWIDYYNSPYREDIYNVISLEVTDSPLGGLIEVPDIVKKLSWVEQLWPMVGPPHSTTPHHCDKSSTPNRYTNRALDCHNQYGGHGGADDLASAALFRRKNASYRELDEYEEEGPGQGAEKLTPPCVEKYCLMSVKDSYTDFHVDFGGSSVWYHLLKGEKIFYLIPPTKSNLEAYEKWSMMPNQTEVFFGDMVETVYKSVLKQGQTLFLPSGWIHAVLTPVDSLVFGGNFLHSFNAKLQFEVYDLEVRLQTSPRFMFPNFDIINWYAGRSLAEQLTDYHTSICQPPQCLVTGCFVLFEKLKTWNKNPEHKLALTPDINTSKILRELARALKMLKITGIDEKPISYTFGEKVSKQSTRKGSQVEEDSLGKDKNRIDKYGADAYGDSNKSSINLSSASQASSAQKVEAPIKIKLKVKRKGTSSTDTQPGIEFDSSNNESKPSTMFSPEYTIDHQAYSYAYEPIQNSDNNHKSRNLTKKNARDEKIDNALMEHFKGSRYDDGDFVYPPCNIEEDSMESKAKRMTKGKLKLDQKSTYKTMSPPVAKEQESNATSETKIDESDSSNQRILEEIKRSHDYAKPQPDHDISADNGNVLSQKNIVVKKVKKGLSTPKQRLAKIMKLQKMVRY